MWAGWREGETREKRDALKVVRMAPTLPCLLIKEALSSLFSSKPRSQKTPQFSVLFKASVPRHMVVLPLVSETRE